MSLPVLFPLNVSDLEPSHVESALASPLILPFEAVASPSVTLSAFIKTTVTLSQRTVGVVATV